MSAVPMHPEAVPGHPAALLWTVPDGLFPRSGKVIAAPGELGALLSGGELAELRLTGGKVLVELNDVLGWRRNGDAIRQALGDALSAPGTWTLSGPASVPPPADDESLRAALVQLLDGAAGDFIRSHGGRPTIVSVHDGVVTLRLGGTCGACPAAGQTVATRITAQLRESHPEVRCVLDAPVLWPRRAT
ncbi:hypothetical protein ATY41_09440 [Leifsonia xyli subsp. xyli]|uniref:NIF system FeS cluster assembly NifU C-terminal domain-containing protein n=1 Tax=Leifsonia xyli subsp. xyli TaxID=59736 RepID=A0A1E2SLA3_LEIXY|nr:NifU family protein [Leifsonia xyli]ODA90636.1 hypothetical protein ATY41_09440 [Leifsonia xyli subsp. xyli]